MNNLVVFAKKYIQRHVGKGWEALKQYSDEAIEDIIRGVHTEVSVVELIREEARYLANPE